MLSDTLHLIVSILFTLFGVALLIRAWAFAIRLHPFNPWSRTIFQLSDWLVLPIRRLVSPGQRLDWPSILACWVTAFLYLILSWTLLTGSLPAPQALLPAIIAALLTMARWAFTIILWATLIQAVLSWVNPMAPIMPILTTFTAPLLNPIRRYLPNLGGLDLSPLVLLILAQIVMTLLQNMAFALFGV